MSLIWRAVSLSASAAIFLQLSSVVGAAPAVQSARLKALAAKIAASRDISYTSQAVLYSMPDSPASSKSMTYDTSVSMLRPAYISITASRGGKELLRTVDRPSGGVVYDSSGNRYVPLPPAKEWVSQLGDIGMASMSMSGLFPLAAVTSSLTGLVSKSPFAHGGEDSVTTANAVLHGKPVVVVTLYEKEGRARIATRVTLDGVSNLPEVIDISVNYQGRTIPVLHEQYSHFVLGSGTASAKDFGFAPPDSATKFTPPAEPAVLADGKTAPDFTATDIEGASVKLSDYAGKVVLIDFWATWCGPCQDLMPHVEDVAKAYVPKGVVVLGVNTWDDKDKFAAWVKARKKSDVSFVYDPAGQKGDASIAMSGYGVSGIPTEFVIGKDGKVVGSSVGDDTSEASVKSFLDSALAAPAPAPAPPVPTPQATPPTVAPTAPPVSPGNAKPGS